VEQISQIKWDILKAEVAMLDRVITSVRRDRHKDIVDFIRAHTVGTQCFTATVVEGSSDLVFDMGVVESDPVDEGRLGYPAHLFFIPSGKFRLGRKTVSESGPYMFVAGEPSHDVIMSLLEQRVANDSPVPAVDIPEGYVIFRFDGLWAAGGYDDEHPTEMQYLFREDSLEKAFRDLQRAFRSGLNGKTHFGNIYAAVHGQERWRRLNIEPAEAMYRVMSPEFHRFRLANPEEPFTDL